MEPEVSMIKNISRAWVFKVIGASGRGGDIIVIR